MPSEFWVSWQLWEKLCFCLSSAIVLVVITGCIKLIYNVWRLRRYAAVAARKAATIHDIMKEMPKEVRRGRDNDVPFGVRAIQSGIEVDGVWVSNSNTPASSVHGSPEMRPSTRPPQLDLTRDRLSASTEVPRLELQRSKSAEPHFKPPPGLPKTYTAFDGAGSSTRQYDPPLTSDHKRRGRPSYEPRRSSHLRYSNSINPEDEKNLEALVSRSVPDDRHGKRREDSVSDHGYRKPFLTQSKSKGGRDRSVQSHSELPVHTPHCPLSTSINLAPEQQPSSSRKVYDAQYAADTHESHVDDKGHLLVRNRQNGITLGYGPVQHASPQRPASPEYKASDPFITPDGSPVDASTRPLHIDKQASKHEPSVTATHKPRHIQSRTQPLQPFDGNRQLRLSQVIRKVNSGFEILRPGTLGDNSQNTDNPEDGAAVPDDDRRHSKKLHKKPRHI